MDRIEEAKEDEKEKDASRILSILASMAGYDSFEKTSLGNDAFFLKFIKKNDKAYCYVSMFNMKDQMPFPCPTIFSTQDDESVIEKLFHLSEEGYMLVTTEYGSHPKTVKLIDAHESLEEFLIKNDLKTASAF